MSLALITRESIVPIEMLQSAFKGFIWWRELRSSLLFLGFMPFLTAPIQAQTLEYREGALTIVLSEQVEAAVNSGVPLTFLCEYAVVKKIFFFEWADQIESHQFVVTHHALSNQYLVNDETNLAPKIFRTMTDTMAFIAERSVTLFSRYQARASDYQMRVRLSKYELPGPLRLNAFIAKGWNLDTGWEEWQFAQ